MVVDKSPTIFTSFNQTEEPSFLNFIYFVNIIFDRIGVTQPIFVGASDGGMVAQIYTQKYPKEVGGIILISTGGMDAATLKKP